MFALCFSHFHEHCKSVIQTNLPHVTMKHYKNGLFPPRSFTHFLSLGRVSRFSANRVAWLPENLPQKRLWRRCWTVTSTLVKPLRKVKMKVTHWLMKVRMKVITRATETSLADVRTWTMWTGWSKRILQYGWKHVDMVAAIRTAIPHLMLPLSLKETKPRHHRLCRNSDGKKGHVAWVRLHTSTPNGAGAVTAVFAPRSLDDTVVGDVYLGDLSDDEVIIMGQQAVP